MADNYGMVIYVTVINFFLPAFILSPLFVKWSRLTELFVLRRDLSSDMLADDATLEMDDDPDIDFDMKKRDSLDSLEWDRKPSMVTQLFLTSDKNFARTLFAMATMQALTW
jgi:hypothetical protein